MIRRKEFSSSIFLHLRFLGLAFYHIDGYFEILVFFGFKESDLVSDDGNDTTPAVHT